MHRCASALGALLIALSVVLPAQARFLSADPVPPDKQTGENFNRYAYANNSPYVFVDPDGRIPLFIPIVAGVSLVVATGESASGSRDAFKQESRRLDSHGGPKSDANYNQIESPGKRFREEDREP